MVHGKNRIPYWIDRRLTGLVGPEYHAIISFGLPIEPEGSQYGEYRVNTLRLDRLYVTTWDARMSIVLLAPLHLSPADK